MIVVFVFVCFHQLEGIQLVFFFVTELIFNLFFFFIIFLPQIWIYCKVW